MAKKQKILKSYQNWRNDYNIQDVPKPKTPIVVQAADTIAFDKYDLNLDIRHVVSRCYGYTSGLRGFMACVWKPGTLLASGSVHTGSSVYAYNSAIDYGFKLLGMTKAKIEKEIEVELEKLKKEQKEKEKVELETIKKAIKKTTKTTKTKKPQKKTQIYNSELVKAFEKTLSEITLSEINKKKGIKESSAKEEFDKLLDSIKEIKSDALEHHYSVFNENVSFMNPEKDNPLDW